MFTDVMFINVSPLLRNYRHPVKLRSKVHMWGGDGGEDEGQDANDFKCHDSFLRISLLLKE